MLQFYEDSCLVRQKFVMGDDQSVQVLSTLSFVVAQHMHADLLGAASAGLCSGLFVAHCASGKPNDTVACCLTAMCCC